VATFVVVHGAWGGAWSWNKFVVPRLRASGHTVFAATLTGLGDRTHLAHPGVDLDTHVQDVANVLFYEDLHDVILVGHSYGGRVITGVADTSADRLAHLVYLDAFVPTPENPGGTTISAASQARIDAEGDGWRNPPGDAPPDQPSEIIEWARPRRSWQPVKTFTQPVRFTNPVPNLARTYVYCSVGKDPSSPFAKLALQCAMTRRGPITNWRPGTTFTTPPPTTPLPSLQGSATRRTGARNAVRVRGCGFPHSRQGGSGGPTWSVVRPTWERRRLRGQGYTGWGPGFRWGELDPGPRVSVPTSSLSVPWHIPDAEALTPASGHGCCLTGDVSAETWVRTRGVLAGQPRCI